MRIFKKIGFVTLNVLMSLLLVFTIAINAVAMYFQPLVDGFIGTYEVETDGEVYENLLEEGEELAVEIMAEGAVLVKNEDKVLPLSEETKKVNVFGWGSTQWIGSGSGSAQVTYTNTGILEALSAYGIETNAELTQMYEDFLNERPYSHALSVYAHEMCRLYEPSIADTDYYTQDMLENAKAFSDTAIVVLSRYCGEGDDCPKVQYKVSKIAGEELKESDVVTDESRTYLDMSTEEEELLTYVGANFDKVIVVVNYTNPMTLGQIETIEGVDSCLLVGTTGTNAATAIPQILYGEVNPSGRTVDTFAYDLSTSAAYANVGIESIGAYREDGGAYPNDGESVNGGVSDDPLYDQVSYIDYAENIYIGYKWYETADVEGYWDSVSNTYGTGYEGVVQYPFGYGLSYTTFEQEIVSVTPNEKSLPADGMISVTIKVTNTGSVAGKDVVQLYYSAPYIQGGIEKSAVELIAFEKTEVLAPKESKEYTLTIDVYDMASYDCYDANENGFMGYELDAGNYEIKVMKNAHEVYGENCTAIYSLAESVKYEKDPVTGAVVMNRFTGEDALDGLAVDGTTSGENIIYLTRADFAGTFPKENDGNRIMSEILKETNLYTEEMANAWIDETDEDITTGANNGYILYDENGFTDTAYTLGADYDSPLWDDVLDQMTIEEMENLILHGYSSTKEVESIGKIQTKEYDGPAQMADTLVNYGLMESPTGYPGGMVLGQTWNQQLAEEYGLMMGKQSAQQGIEGWYAPSINLHRTTLGGRCYEYFSEDSVLSGYMAAAEVRGAKNAGMYCFIKHLIAYEQDSYRSGMYTWMTEQSLRELYLKPFRIAIQEGGATGLMSSYNRIGGIWTGGSKALQQCVVRDEFGFDGTIITDYAEQHIFMNGDQMLRTGGSLWMDGIFVDGEFMFETESNSYKQALREASKNIIYTWCNAGYANKVYNETSDEPIVRPVEIETGSVITWLLQKINPVLLPVLFLWIACLVWRVIRKKKARG